MSFSASDRSDSAEAARTARSSWLYTIWNGRSAPATRWSSLIGAIVALLLANILYNMTRATVRWDLPLKFVGWLCLALMIGALAWFMVAIVRVLRQMGLKRLLIRLVILSVTGMAFVGLLVPTGLSGTAHWSASVTRIGTWIADETHEIFRWLITAPEEINFAATGRRDPIPVPGVDWPNGVPPTPIVVRIGVHGSGAAPATRPTSVSASAVETDPSAFHIGDQVHVTGTDGASLLVRAEPSTGAKIIAKVTTGSKLIIVDGPRVADGRSWWRVRSGDIEGWCASTFLTKADT